MYAIVSLKGQQYRLEPGLELDVDRLAGEPGDSVTIEDSVLLAKDDAGVKTGTPVLAGSKVQLEILKQFRDKKIIVFKMKRRKRCRRKNGHRQDMTRVRVTDISLG